MTEPASPQVLLVVELTTRPGTQREMREALDRHLPVMAVGGEQGVFGAAVAENLRHGASDVRQEVLADCGHYVSEERPEELASLLLGFFDGT